MIDQFKNMIKIGVKFPKKDVRLPKNWPNFTRSQYSNERNYAILTGKTNDIIVIDIDNKDPEFSGLVWFQSKFGNIKELDTLVTETINKGFHVYFKYTELIKSRLNIDDLHIDILADKRCVYEGYGYNIVCNKVIRELTSSEIDTLTTERNLDLDVDQDLETIHIDINNNTLLSHKQLEKILSGLSISRVDNREDWLRVGYYLTNYPDGKAIFESWSKRSKKYNSERHEYDWESLLTGESQINLGTIMLFLKEDNPKLFDTIVRDNKILQELDKLTLQKGIKNTEITRLTKKKIEVECDITLDEIIMLHNAKSKRCPGCEIYGSCDDAGYILLCKFCKFSHPEKRLQIDRLIAPTIFNTLVINNKDDDIANKDTSQVAAFIKDRSKLLYVPKQWYLFNNVTGIYELQREEDVIELIDKMFNDDDEEWSKWVKKINYKKNLLEELKNKCIIPKDIELDNYNNLLGFSNGVYDFNSGDFRPGLETEFVSMICKHPYNPDVDTTLATEILSTTFMHSDEREYAKNRFSLILEGENREQTMTFNYGFTASNGKSFLMERICNSMGDYGDSFNVNLLTNKMSSAGDANSTLINFKNKRFMYCSEPEANAKLNTNFVKMLTGDVIKARGLYAQNDESINPTYNIFVCCNALPEFDTYDEGIARRIRLLEYSTKFTETPKKPNEYIIKKYTREELKLIEMGLMKIFLDNYIKLKEDNYKYVEPEKLCTLKNIYINTNKDDIKNILTEQFEEGIETDFIKLKDVKSLLKDNNITKDIVSIKYIIQDIFPDCVFYERRMQNYIRVKNIFTNLKTID